MAKTFIIPRTEQIWQKVLADIITDPAELFTLLDLDTTHLPAAYQAAQLFPLRIPRDFVKKMRKNDLHDPLLRQVLPLGEELVNPSCFTADPLKEQEKKFNPLPGLLHKYKNRVLLVMTGSCLINCRFCFRREFPYSDNNPGRQGWNKVIQYIRQHQEIHEVIWSGGDPLVVTDNLLEALILDIASIPHVKRLRIHSRIPILTATRITPAFINLLTRTRLQPILVVHSNHANEIDDEIIKAMHELRKAGVTLLNQSVLLKGINDSTLALVELSERLFEAGILPYYLHLLDKVKGTAHFEVSKAQGKTLVNELRDQLPGFLVPRLVHEIAGDLSKRLLG